MGNGTSDFAVLFKDAATKSRHIRRIASDATVERHSVKQLSEDVLRLRDMPSRERPRERMRELGPEALTAAELVAVLLGRGVKGADVKRISEELVARYEGLEMLSRASWDELRSIAGIKDAKAAQLLAAFELGRRASAYIGESDIGRDLGGPSMIAEMMTPLLRDKPREEMWIIFLDVRNRYRGKSRMYAGCSDQIVAKSGEVVGAVLERKCPRFVIVHNHPSGRGDPSAADITFTQKLLKASRMLDIELVDHIVVGGNDWVSMRTSNLVDFGA